MLRKTDTAAKVRRAVIRLWVGQPSGAFGDGAMLRKMDAVVYEAVQLMIRRRWRQIRRLRIARRQVNLAPGFRTLEGERWITIALARILPRLVEFARRADEEGSDL
ncbi:MAG: hypothetical protein Kow00120_18620 [Anaerolineae bacterium]